ncbi:Hsp70 family protein [Desulfonema magnum]|uniref:Chaperone protein DnaK-like domain-containing protein n=1 Tax=Desulfonema magnum TaxID=45655 RepID=A0A975BS93_9BACT|nr:Hsp70 family protein [Desulfonema magnum]QTA90787.1 Chaperone protein DnaK-like domain-containing protein [Desulfonema magnum]
MVDGLYLGIDFGTATNYVTKWDPERKIAVPVRIDKRLEGDNFFDNVIYYESSENRMIGKLAFQRSIDDPLNVVEGIRDKLGRDNWKQMIPSLGCELSSEEVTEDIFREMKNRVEQIHGGIPVKGVVLGIPFSFQSEEISRLKTASENVGLSIIKLIEEPVAIAIACGLFDKLSDKKREKVLIFDLGGETSDITIFDLFRQSNNVVGIELLYTKTDALGGKRIEDILIKKFEENIGYELALIPDERQRRKDHLMLIEAAREVIQNLCADEEDEVFCSGLDGGRIFERKISLREFNKWLRGHGFISRIKEMLQDALDEAGDIDRIILAGGSGNIPIIQSEIQNFFGQQPELVGNPAEFIGKGAGIYCGGLLTGNLNYEIITPIGSVSSYDIGLKVGEKFIPFRNEHEIICPF